MALMVARLLERGYAPHPDTGESTDPAAADSARMMLVTARASKVPATHVPD